MLKEMLQIKRENELQCRKESKRRNHLNENKYKQMQGKKMTK